MEKVVPCPVPKYASERKNTMRTTNELIKTDGTREPLRDGELTLGEMYSAIGCDIVERVDLQDGKSELWADENGLMKSDFIVNEVASGLYSKAYETDEVGIVGNAILTVNHKI